MRSIIPLLLLAVFCVGCRNNQQNAVVKETYIHKYGVPVTKTDWEKQGETGQVVQLRNDGVTVTRSYIEGVLDGETTYTLPNSSTIHRVETYERNQLVAVRDHYQSGVPRKEQTFEKGKLVKMTRWYEDGTPAATEAYSGPLILSGEYRTSLNVVESRVVNGKGIRICRKKDGELFSKDTIENGEMVERITYFPNGDPSVITPFKHGAIHGTRLTYLPGGQPNTSEEWVHGVQEGITIVYQNGEKASEITYQQGKKSGMEHRFRDGTLLVEDVTWSEDLQHGPHHIYVDGETKTEWYHQGNLVNRATYERMNGPTS